ncbi:MAG: hypothetical protein HY816_09350 [Candidatus Wallbacteria bacterium]|nr:hypothetical protein [Candidatus Wallbacteria bacterium]
MSRNRVYSFALYVSVAAISAGSGFGAAGDIAAVQRQLQDRTTKLELAFRSIKSAAAAPKTTSGDLDRRANSAMEAVPGVISSVKSLAAKIAGDKEGHPNILQASTEFENVRTEVHRVLRFGMMDALNLLKGNSREELQVALEVAAEDLNDVQPLADQRAILELPSDQITKMNLELADKFSKANAVFQQSLTRITGSPSEATAAATPLIARSEEAARSSHAIATTTSASTSEAAAAVATRTNELHRVSQILSQLDAAEREYNKVNFAPLYILNGGFAPAVLVNVWDDAFGDTTQHKTVVLKEPAKAGDKPEVAKVPYSGHSRLGVQFGATAGNFDWDSGRRAAVGVLVGVGYSLNSENRVSVGWAQSVDDNDENGPYVGFTTSINNLWSIFGAGTPPAGDAKTASSQSPTVITTK